MPATRTVVFDMDGTLVQSRAAAWDVFQDTVEKFNLPIAGREEFFDLFRDNFFLALRDLSGPQADAVGEHFLTALRERYTPELIPGMTDVVHALAGHFSLAVISSNAMGAIRRTLDHSGVAHCFAHVFSGDVENEKQVSLRRILADPSYNTVRRCAPDYVEAGVLPDRARSDQVVLVTDTVGDVREGRSCGIRVIGVSWGMHSAEDLLAAGAEFVALWPQELVARLLPDGSCTPGGCECLSCSVTAPPANLRAERTASPTSAPVRDVRSAAVAAGALRRSRRSGAPTSKPSPTSCQCSVGIPCQPKAGSAPAPDPYLRYALTLISQPP
ncbi:MAG: HAD family hydrolase [Sporichthyaceae bacterium]